MLHSGDSYRVLRRTCNMDPFCNPEDMCNLGIGPCVLVPVLFAGTRCYPLLERSYWYVASRKTARQHLIIPMAIQTYLKTDAAARTNAINSFEKGMSSWGVDLPNGVQNALIQIAKTP